LKLIRLSPHGYKEQIGDTDLEKVFRILLGELISTHLGEDKNVPISKDSYSRLKERIPAFCLNDKKMKIVFLEEDSRMLLIEDHDAKPQLRIIKRKRKMLNSSSKKRRRIYRKFK